MTFATIFVKTLLVVMMFRNVVAVDTDIVSWFHDSYSTAMSTASDILAMATMQPQSTSNDFEVKSQPNVQKIADQVHLAGKLKKDLENLRNSHDELIIDSKLLHTVDGLPLTVYQYQTAKENLHNTEKEYEEFDDTMDNLQLDAFTWIEEYILMPFFYYILDVCEYIAKRPILYNFFWCCQQFYMHFAVVLLLLRVYKGFTRFSDWMKAFITVFIVFFIAFLLWHFLVFKQQATNTEVLKRPKEAWNDCVRTRRSGGYRYTSARQCKKDVNSHKTSRFLWNVGSKTIDKSSTEFDLNQRLTYGFVGDMAEAALWTVVEMNGSRMEIIEENKRREIESKISDLKVRISKYQGQIDGLEHALANSVSSAILTRGIEVSENILALPSSPHNASPTCD